MPDARIGSGHSLKITVVLLQRHVAALDHLAVSIRLHSGVALSRASIIDAFITASAERPDALVEQLLKRTSKPRKKRSEDSAKGSVTR